MIPILGKNGMQAAAPKHPAWGYKHPARGHKHPARGHKHPARGHKGIFNAAR